MRLSRVLLVLVTTVPALSGCSSSAAGAGPCGTLTREALDPGSIQHVLSGSSARYLTDPPTSGAHQPSPPISRTPTAPIPKPVQVGILEQGHVVVQYRGIAAGELARLRRLASDDVVVAPAAELPRGQRVVATAWLYKQSCTTVDVAALQRFISARTGHGPT